MFAAETRLPCRRQELVVRSLGDDGLYVVKDPRTGAYYHLGQEEQFLLDQLDGRSDAGTVRNRFAQRFGEMLDDRDLDDFLDIAGERGLLQSNEPDSPQTPAFKVQQPNSPPNIRVGESSTLPFATGPAPFGLRLLFWRKSLFDPDRFFTRLAPKIWFFWTRPYFLLSSGCIAVAAVMLFANRHELAGAFLNSLRWETALLAWLSLMGILTCHEFAHGLTCKRYGGEVHEVGFLLMFFMPCFYCNVSDAWLFKEKSKRLWVTLAGGFFELFLWALSVFVWRLTSPDTLLSQLSLIVLTACGVQTLFNLNPLLKLDGYYLLSDWLEIPNLQQRSADFLKAQLRWLLWGAERPAPEPHHRTLLVYGLLSWTYSLAFLGLTLFVMSRVFGERMGWLGLAAVALLTLFTLRALFHGISAGEVRNMLAFRHKRTVIWLLLLVAVPAALFAIPMEDRAGGTFRLRAATRAEIRAPVAGFLKEIGCSEGDRVSPSAILCWLEVPDLASRLAQKRAEAVEMQAKLRVLTIGARPEEIAEQRQRAERAAGWRDRARQDLQQAKRALVEELDRLDKHITVAKTEQEVALGAYQRAQALVGSGAQPKELLAEAKGKYLISEARVAEACAAKRAKEALGTLEAESEVARRERELADVQAALRLLEAGVRLEEIQAEQARLARVQEEIRHLDALSAKQVVASPIPGIMTTSRAKEKVGQFFREGDLICVIEESDGLEADIALAEQDVARVRPGQRVELKVRALPFDSFVAQVDRVAPAAAHGDVQSTVLVTCSLPSSDAKLVLRPEMTGYARIYTSRRSVGEVACERALRFLRTEFWW